MKLAIDIHGVIDNKFLGAAIQKFFDEGHTIYILTGMHHSEEAEEYLAKHGFVKGINYHHFLSVADYHKKLGTPMFYDERNRPWLDNDIWNKTKAKMCKKYIIDVLIDDSKIYGQTFTDGHCTQYILYNKDTIFEDLNDIKNTYNTKEPYITVKKTVYDFKFNPNYDFDAICQCGHKYIDHFDDETRNFGCLKCQCGTFRLKDNKNEN